MRIAFILAVSSALLGCSDLSPPPASKQANTPDDLVQFFDCLETSGKAVVAAHRAGPAPGYPENSMASMERMVKNGVWLMEIDIRTSRDGVMFLHHDEELDYSTTGKGKVADLSWEELRGVSLRDMSGEPTPYRFTRFDEALRWADGKAILQLDIKPGTDYDDVALAVKSAQAQDRVIPIGYNKNQALALNKRFPNSVISVPVLSKEELAELTRRGLSADRILAWGGTEIVDGTLYEYLGSQNVEVAFGTLGGRDSHDEQIRRSGNDSNYANYIPRGIDILSTDRPLAAKQALIDADVWADLTSCPF